MPKSQVTGVHLYVAAITLLGAGALAIAGISAEPFPGGWSLGVLLVLVLLLEVSGTRSKTRVAAGSIAFLGHLASLVLFGAFWAGAIGAVSSLSAQLGLRRPIVRIIFNAGQITLSICIAGLAYKALGGQVPPSFFGSNAGLEGGALSDLAFDMVVRDLIAFVGMVIVYFFSNSITVSGVVALSSGQKFFEVWRTNSFWVFGYDVAASWLALVVAWFYTLFNGLDGFTRLGFLAVVLPVIVVRHVYGKLNTLQSLYDQLDAAHAKLEQNMREQLAMMVKSIEARDPYTSGHSRRVAVLSRTIAREFGLADDLVDEVSNAALMHDVGKIHAEFAPLLSKEGKLTPDEWEVMKTHAVKSEELVAMFSRWHGTVQAAVRSHHERWDGLGYPDGTVGDAIPIGARIIMIADTIDAMTTERPYRKPLGFDVVISELQKHRGTQFDPTLVDRVINSVPIRRLATEEGASFDVDLHGSSEQPVSLRSHGNIFVSRRREPGR